MNISDDKYNYGIYLDDSQSEDGWMEYQVKEKTYRRGYNSTKWSSYTDNEYNANAPGGDTTKTYLPYVLSHLKKAKISAETSKTYVITGSINIKNCGYKKAVVTINKKTGKVTKIKYTLKAKTRTYLNSTDTYTVTGGTNTLSNISYGDSTITLSDELQGL